VLCIGDTCSLQNSTGSAARITFCANLYLSGATNEENDTKKIKTTPATQPNKRGAAAQTL
jgi:hypothetical protein